MESKPANFQVPTSSLVFSAIKCAVDSKKESKLEKRDKLRGRDYKRLITKVEKIGQRLDTIREKNPEKAGQIENNIKWERALKRASGVVVKDNMVLLRKGLKRKLKNKERRKKNWEVRKKNTEAGKMRRQRKRQDNIEKREKRSKKKTSSKGSRKGARNRH